MFWDINSLRIPLLFTAFLNTTARWCLMVLLKGFLGYKKSEKILVHSSNVPEYDFTTV
jgi:hypothetical protein